jgi:AraC-like DNA-binding protein
VHDLLALSLGATREAAAMARARGAQAARLEAIKSDVLTNLAARDLTLDAVARRHGISPRYVRKLFESVGTSFSDFVVEQRLAQAHRRLTDPRFAARAISAIAFEVGFGDLSHFNRTFRRRFGATPSEVRAAGLRQRS